MPANQSAMVAITTGHPVHTCYNIFWPPGLQWLQYILATWSAIDTIDSGQSIYSGLNAELVLSGHSIQDGDCPMFGHPVGFRTPAGIGRLDRNGVLSSRVGGSRWGNPLKGLIECISCFVGISESSAQICLECGPISPSIVRNVSCSCLCLSLFDLILCPCAGAHSVM